MFWLGRNNETAVYVGDVLEYEIEGGVWVKGKIGFKRNGRYVFRVGKREYPLFMMCELRVIEGQDNG